MKVLDNELNLDKLENVVGGTSPRYPAGVDNGKSLGTNLLNNIGDVVLKQSGSSPAKPFAVCPKCHSTAVSFNTVENICMCQDCGYCEDYSK